MPALSRFFMLEHFLSVKKADLITRFGEDAPGSKIGDVLEACKKREGALPPSVYIGQLEFHGVRFSCARRGFDPQARNRDPR